MRMLSLSTAALLAACATQSGLTPRQEADRWALTNARATGPEQSCISRIRIRETRVRSEQVIDFVMNDGQVMRSTLPQSCPSLAFEERFGYSTSIDQLCSTDIIYVLHTDGSRGAGCGLGRFQPVEIARRPGR